MLDVFYVFLFISELLIWLGIGRLAYLHTKGSKGLAILFGILATVLIIVFWAFFLAPKADYRLLKLPRTLLIVVMSLITGYALYVKEDRVFSVTILTFATLMQFVGQYFMAAD